MGARYVAFRSLRSIERCQLSFILIAATLLSLPASSDAATFRVAVMGDSISAGSSSTNWIGQLKPTGAFTFTNKAVGGATSSTVVSGQLASVVNLAAGGQIDASVLMIGGNDATSNIGYVTSGNTQQFINIYYNNVKNIIDSISAANPAVKQVFVNMPDVTLTPLVQSYATQYGFTQQQLAALSDAIHQTNQAINTYVLSKGIPVVDFGSASPDLLAAFPLTLGGATFTTPFASDNFHPAPVTQGLLANLVDTAFNLGYGLSLPILSDQQIARNAGKTPNNLTTYFDVSPLVLVPVPEVSPVALIGFIVVLGVCIPGIRKLGRAV
jgi:lysophospholipase L1-like esterase